MQIEIINTGSELMLGRVLNTHQQWLCRQLADHGYVVDRQIGVHDEPRAIQQSVREALQRSDLILTTGGLGPTSDDLTRDLIAQLLDRRLYEDSNVLANIERFFRARNRDMPASTRIQAMVPERAQVLPNDHGTAPGLAIQLDPRSGQAIPQWLILLPGPPRELHPMFLERVLPLIQQQYPHNAPFVCRTLRTTGLGESLVEQRIAEPLRPWTTGGKLELGYCARTGEVDVRLVSRVPGAAAIVAEAESVCSELLAKHLFGTDDDTLEAVIIRRLVARQFTIGTAESCTGGYLANRLTNVPGASAVLRGALVAYHNDIKKQMLGVAAETIEKHGAVSEPTAKAMADGARRVLGVDYAISITGIAGPGGGSPEKPVGTVFIGLASPRATIVIKQLNPFDRETFKYVTSQQALNLLRRTLADEAHKD